jgi:hypothetical protein
MRKDIKKSLRGRSLSFLGANREIRRLEDYLQPGEEVHDLLACNFGDTGGRSLLVVTDERILVFKDGWIFRNSQSMGYEDIKTIEIRTGLFWGKIKFKGEGMNFAITKVGRFSAEHAMKIMRSRIGPRYHTWEAQRQQLRVERDGLTNGTPTPVPSSPAAPAKPPAFYETDEPLTLDQFLKPITGEEPKTPEKSNSLIDELERLQVLLEKGVLTQEEYASAKKKLLS